MPVQYFTDAHEELRLHIRRFLEKEVVPHLEEWEETLFPDSIFKRFGELGFLGLRYPPELGGQGGDEYVINGRKIFITNGARCAWCLVVAKTDSEAGHGGFSLFVVPKETPGFQVTRTLKKLGMHSSDTAELLFDYCRVPLDCRRAEEGEGW